jgi:hypothetical protein
MRRNWYSPCPPVVAVRSVLDSAFVSATLAPTMALPSGSVTVPRTDVVACPRARPVPNMHARKVNARVKKIAEHCEDNERESRWVLCAYLPLPNSDWFFGYCLLKRSRLHLAVCSCQATNG